MECTTPTTAAADGLLQASITQANRDPDDVEQIASTIRLLRARQLRRSDSPSEGGQDFREAGASMIDTDTLPHEPESERYVLGCMIQYPDCREGATKLLRATDFVEPAHAAIYDVFSRQFANGDIDLVLAGREVKHLPFFTPDGNAAGYLYELKEGVATGARVVHEAGKIVAARRKRQRIQYAESLLEHAQDGYTHDQFINEACAGLDDMRREAASGEPRFKVYSAAELDSATFETTFDIERLLVSGEPLALGAPKSI